MLQIILAKNPADKPVQIELVPWEPNKVDIIREEARKLARYLNTNASSAYFDALRDEMMNM